MTPVFAGGWVGEGRIGAKLVGRGRKAAALVVVVLAVGAVGV